MPYRPPGGVGLPEEPGVRRSSLSGLVLGVVLCARVACGGLRIGVPFEDEAHYLILWGEATIGRAHEKTSSRQLGQQRLLTIEREEFVRAVFGRNHTLERRRSVQLLTPELLPLSFQEEVDENGVRRFIRIELKGRAVSYEREVAGQKRQTTITAPGQLPVLWSLDGRVLAQRKLLEVGKSLTALVVAQQVEGFQRLKATVVAQTAAAGGGQVRYVVRVQDVGPDGKPIKEPSAAARLVVFADGRLYERTIGPYRLLRVPPAGAVLPQKIPVISNDLRTTAAPNAHLPATRELEHVQRMLVTITPPPGDDGHTLSSGRYQEVLFQDGVYRLGLFALRPDGREKKEELPQEMRRRYLSPSPLVQSDHPEIKSLAAELARSGTDELLWLYCLHRYVETHLRKLPYGAAEGSALEALRDGFGDCTEHAALLAALCRAAEIPARRPAGLVYEGQRFGFHVWVEGYVGGRWVACDPVLRRFGLPGLYLCLGYLEDDQGKIDAVLLRLATQAQATIQRAEIAR